MWGLKMSEYKYPGLIKLREGCGRKFGYDYDIELCEEDNYCPECQRAIETAESIEKEIKELDNITDNEDYIVFNLIDWEQFKSFIQKGEKG